MSLNATLMYAAKRTYPEISFPVVYLSSRYNKATEVDYKKAMRVAEYIVTCGESHCLRLAPKSLQIIARLMLNIRMDVAIPEDALVSRVILRAGLCGSLLNNLL